MTAGRALLWLAPPLLHAADAHAWGLYTHMYFAQLLVWALPLADPRFRRALCRFPQLCCAGACLPDVALFSGLARVAALSATHPWRSVSELLRHAADDAERAIALGYASHLLTDIVAHNHFVPAHEAIWFKASMLSHASCEWAMDAHVAPQLFVRPATLMTRHADVLADFAARRLGCAEGELARALRYLACGEAVLRASRLPQVIYRTALLADGALVGRFDRYIRETSLRLRQIDRLVSGEVPAWLPEPRERASPRAGAFAPADFFHRV